MSESSAILAALRRQLSAAPGHGAARPDDRFGLGDEAIDTALGGLPRGRLHEVHPEGVEEGPSAIGFALMLALRACPAGAPILWVRAEAKARRQGRIHAPGLVELGAEPGRMIFVAAPDTQAALRVAADIVRSPGVGVALIEPGGKSLGLTASRRLALAAGQSGVTALLLPDPAAEGAAPAPSAAFSRWSVRAAPSAPLEAGAPGHPAFAIELLRHRAGLAGLAWRVEWDRDRLAFRDAPLSGAVAPLPADRGSGVAERRYA